MPKRPKTKRRPEPDIREQLANAFKTLRELRAWEDQVINELERLCAKSRRIQRSKPRKRAGQFD